MVTRGKDRFRNLLIEVFTMAIDRRVPLSSSAHAEFWKLDREGTCEQMLIGEYFMTETAKPYFTSLCHGASMR